jgi:GT2 family glycosyltransferase
MVGIVILNFNTFGDSKECIESIRKTTNSAYHIYLVDNASTDNSASNLKAEYESAEDTTVILNTNNGGYSFGNNIGIKAAISDGCDYILISNPDIVFYDSAIDILLSDLQDNAEIGAIGPSTESLDQQESQLLRKTYTLKLYAFSKKPLRYLRRFNSNLQSEYPYPSGSQKMPYLFHGMVRGCCFLMRASDFEKIGLFDEHVFLYSEEWIIAYKLQKIGLWGAFDNRSKVLHKEATSTKKVGTGFQSYHLYLSAFYYVKQYLEVNKAIQYMLYFQNTMNFRLKALRDDSYKKLLNSFILSNAKLLHAVDASEMNIQKETVE